MIVSSDVDSEFPGQRSAQRQTKKWVAQNKLNMRIEVTDLREKSENCSQREGVRLLHTFDGRICKSHGCVCTLLSARRNKPFV